MYAVGMEDWEEGKSFINLGREIDAVGLDR